ncbi:hypothetical protein TL18_05050 [Methanobrevibacter sp. YE315]|uniref:hypothetical protein n=1 Tax=Methanobrevibacter sp. YE315 TaxID=1609968 RepID=UPI000764EDC4|nr:hypothetical protein [Methanobrevibacter sp. YE315]AMD17441.1 hypothetical protein TL18_05050 [Methanobrevibacter sp. YE315]
MSEDKITYNDVEEYGSLFTLAPPFLLEMFAKKNTDLVSKFESVIESYMDNLTDDQRMKLDLVLSSEIEHLQGIMAEAYRITNKKQYHILANPKYSQFIEENLEGIRRLIK